MKTSSFTKDSQMKNVTKEYKNLDETDTKTITPIDVSQNHSNPSERISSFDGQTFVLEYLAPRRSCRVNVVITAFANGTFHFYVQLKMLYLHMHFLFYHMICHIYYQLYLIFQR